jgi:hypothetical protein
MWNWALEKIGWKHIKLKRLVLKQKKRNTETSLAEEMELDYLENVNGLDENVVRLYNFNKAEAILFRDLLVETVILKKEKLNLAEVDFITPRNCNLILGLFKTNEGILTKDNQTFFCVLTLAIFINMIHLLDPFCQKESKGYQYLYDLDNSTELLFSQTASLVD